MKLRFLCIFLLLALSAIPQQQLTWFSLPDIAGSGSAVALGSGTARLCQLVAPPTNTNAVRWGDSAITSSQGSYMAPGSGQFLPPGPGVGQSGGTTYFIFQLSSVFVLVQSGDKITATCAR